MTENQNQNEGLPDDAGIYERIKDFLDANMDEVMELIRDGDMSELSDCIREEVDEQIDLQTEMDAWKKNMEETE